VKEFLSRAGRSFVVKDVEEDPVAFGELTALGVMTVPATVVGSTLVLGFDEEKLKEALDGA
jgi:hypothetical protein